MVSIIIIIAILIVIAVLVLSVLTTSKAYQFKHTIDPPAQEQNNDQVEEQVKE